MPVASLQTLRKFDNVLFVDSDYGLKRFLKEYLRRDGFQRIRTEVNLGSRVADITALKHDELYAFEAKSMADSVDRAFEQCLENLMHADYSIMATTQNVPFRKLQFFRGLGIGVWRVYEPGIIKHIALPTKAQESVRK